MDAGLCSPPHNRRYQPGYLFENIQPRDKLILNITNRYFEAPSTYRGNQFITDILVRNKFYTLNISAIRLLKNGWSMGLSVPFAANSRRNSGDHGGPQTRKHITRSFGVGDIRFKFINGCWIQLQVTKEIFRPGWE